MKLFPISDTHINFTRLIYSIDNMKATFQFLENYDDIVVCACGDIGERYSGLFWLDNLCRLFPNIHVVYVPGNHEFYGTHYDVFIEDLARLSEDRMICNRLHILDGVYNIKCFIGGVTFIGATLWTDYNKEDKVAMQQAKAQMNDYRCIKVNHTFDNLTPLRIVNEHYNQRKRIFAAIQRETTPTHKTVVLTHTQPFISDEVSIDPLKYAFMVDLTKNFKECEYLPTYWFSGHTHKSLSKDLTFNGQTVHCISNQVGYPHEQMTGYTKEAILDI